MVVGRMELVEVQELVGEEEGEELIPRFPLIQLRLMIEYLSYLVHRYSYH